MSETAPSDLRILIGAGSYVDAAAAFRIVERLAGTLRPDIGGLLVEETALDLCQIPGQRVVQARGTTALVPSRAQVRTLMQADARAFQHALAAASRPNGTQRFFAQRRGDLIHATLQAAAGWDLLIIGYRQIHKMPGKIVVLGETTSSEDPMETFGSNVSNQLHADRIRFLVTDGSSPDLHAGIQFETLDDILIALSRLNTEAVLLDLRHGPVENQTDLARILEAARCPVIVFGVATGQAQLTQRVQ